MTVGALGGRCDGPGRRHGLQCSTPVGTLLFISQMLFVPSLLRHRMSDVPSPLKSPIFTTDQLVGTVGSVTLTGEVPPIIPDHIGAVTVAPQDVGHAVAVEIADAGNGPGRGHARQAHARRHSCCRMSQMLFVPSLLRHRMSDLPSPLKSPVPATDQPWARRAGSRLWARCLFMSQSRLVPSLLRHRMSEVPSPLKSPIAGNGQLVDPRVCRSPAGRSHCCACSQITVRRRRCCATGCRTCRRR